MKRGLEGLRHPQLVYNLACYQSLAGRGKEAIRALLEAVTLHPRYAKVASTDHDLDAIRSDPRFPFIVAAPRDRSSETEGALEDGL